MSSKRKLGGKIARKVGARAEAIFASAAEFWALRGVGYLVQLHAHRAFDGAWISGERFDFIGHFDGWLPVAFEIKATTKTGKWSPPKPVTTQKGVPVHREISTLNGFAAVLLFHPLGWKMLIIESDTELTAFDPKATESPWINLTSIDTLPGVVLSFVDSDRG